MSIYFKIFNTDINISINSIEQDNLLPRAVPVLMKHNNLDVLDNRIKFF